MLKKEGWLSKNQQKDENLVVKTEVITIKK